MTRSAAATAGSSPIDDRTGATATQLAAGKWRLLPAAPIKARNGSAVTWTGREMLVWGGGESGAAVFADGAAFDPATRHWRRLPPAPLSARQNPAQLWTGSIWFLWGGQDGNGGDLSDGAFFDPATNVWTRAPAASIAGHTAAFLIDKRLIVVGVNAKKVGVTTIKASVLSVDRMTWNSVDLHLPPLQPALYFSAATDGHRLYLWSDWEFTEREKNGYYSSRTGSESFTFDLAGGWRSAALATAPSPAYGLVSGGQGQIAWTGREFLIGAQPPFHGHGSGGYLMNKQLFGYRLDPVSNQAYGIVHNSLDNSNPERLWVGRGGSRCRTGTTVSAIPDRSRPAHGIRRATCG